MERDEPFDLEAAGQRLRAQWVGPARAQGETCLVFLHEGLGSIGQWKGFPADLCRALGLPGLVYERLGYGGSDPLPGARSLDYLEIEGRAVLPEVLDACAIDRPILTGHSDGGSIALVYAAEYPDRPRACVCLAAHVFVEAETLAGIRDVVARWRAGDLAPRLARYHGANTRAMFHGWADAWLNPGFRDWTIQALLPSIVCPVLVVQGANDAHGTVAQVDAIASGVSGPAARWVIPACGHSPHLEARAHGVARIGRFLATVLGAAGPSGS